jgi:hypothetical protein
LPPQEEGEAAKEGTAAHEELERVLKGGDLNFEHPAIYGVALFADYVRQLRTATPGREWIETRVRLTDEIWGRLDFGHWHAESAVLTVADKKNGFVDVSVEENEQMRVYAASLILQFNIPTKWIRYAICQPNSIVPGPRLKQWTESVDSLRAFAERAAAVPSGPKKFVAGEHCRYCPLFGRCDATRDLLRHLAVMLQHTPDEVSNDQAAAIYAVKRPIEDWFKNFDKTLTKRALSGNVPPGMKVVTTSKHRAWKDPAAARAIVVAQCGVDALDPPTPAQAEKLGIAADVVASLADRPEGGPALAFSSDKRPEFVVRSAAEMFKGVTG